MSFIWNHIINSYMAHMISGGAPVNQTIRMPIPSLPADFARALHDHMRLYSATMLMAESIKGDAMISCS